MTFAFKKPLLIEKYHFQLLNQSEEEQESREWTENQGRLTAPNNLTSWKQNLKLIFYNNYCVNYLLLFVGG